MDRLPLFSKVTVRYAAAVLALLGFSIPIAASAAQFDLGGEPVSATLIESNGSRSVIEIRIGSFEADEVIIDGDTYRSIEIPGEGSSLEAGLPALPNVRRALIIPDDQEMAVTLLDAEWTDFADMPVAPSKGNLLRTVDPASVPYTFDSFYAGDGTYPAQPVTADAPHILRDFRGIVVDANAFQYLPASRTLRVYTRMLIEVKPVGPGQVNVLPRSGLPARMDPQFVKLYANHFMNFSFNLYAPVLEDGGLLIITYDDFFPNVEPLAQWKLQKGIPTKVVTRTQAGSSATGIAAYIQNEYDTSSLAYVLLVGDAAQMPKPAGDSDPLYSLVAGGDDYPDLFVGRFSAEDPAHVDTQVLRTITYERDIGAGLDWPQGGVGIASNEGPGHYGEYDYEHQNNIRDDLMGYGYLWVDQIYDPGASASAVTSALNGGRGIVNYTGHGSPTSWSTTGFNNANVNALVNDNMLPFICSVACNNGTFTSTTCFAETWLRANHGGVPTGAIATYMSYISQAWNPPMYAQDEAVDLLVADAMRTVGGLWFNGSCHMMDVAGAAGAEEFKNWTIFGDPSVCVRTKAPTMMTVDHTGTLLIGMTEYAVSVPGVADALCALYAEGVLYGSATTDGAGDAVVVLSDPPTDPMTLTLTVTAYNKVTVIENVDVLPPQGPHLVFDVALVLDPAGDDDGVLDAGESVGLDVSLANVGVDAATGVSAVLSSDDPFVTVVESDRTYPDIPASGFGSCVEPFVIEIAGNVPDAHQVQLTLTVSADQGSWDPGFGLDVEAPVLLVTEGSVYDGGGGNGDRNANAGETFVLVCHLGNTGRSDAADLTGMLVSMDPNVVIHDGEGTCALAPVGGEALMGQFMLELLPDVPEPSNVDLRLRITNPGGLIAMLDYQLPVGGWLDDFEGDGEWTAGAPGDDAASGIWTRVDPIGTEYNGHAIQPEDDHTADPGALCFITGNGSIGGAAGENDVDGGRTTLLSPVFQLLEASSATISYYRWYSNSWGSDPDQDWWDVEVTNDGQSWVSLEHTQTTLAEWTEFTFDLTDYIQLTDEVQIRFVAADEEPGSLVEAGVDDFLLVATWAGSAALDDDRAAPSPTHLTMGPNFPNPFNPATTIQLTLPLQGEIDLAIYDVGGRRIATLVRGEMPAGSSTVRWDGRNDNGNPVASGTYFARLQFGDRVLTGRLVMVK